MSFGAIITHGESNEQLPADMSKWLAEVRVEQEISKPDKVAIRFEDDICDDSFAVSTSDILKDDNVLSVVVPYEDKERCLTRGRIVNVKTTNQISGAGSSVTVHCEQLIEMDRETIQANWQGNEQNIVQSLLTAYGFKTDVKIPDPKVYDEDSQLNQRGTDLDFLEKLSAESGVSLWIEYDLAQPVLKGGAYKFDETAHFKISPTNKSDSLFSLANRILPSSDEPPSFRLSVGETECPNVNKFEAEIDFERPTKAEGTHIDDASGETNEAKGKGDDNQVLKPGKVLPKISGVSRKIMPVTPGDGDKQTRQSDAALREASWYIDADVSTSVQMLKYVLIPHDVIKVSGASAELSVHYQVKSVVHVVNAADHMMDVKLRSNIGWESR